MRNESERKIDFTSPTLENTWMVFKLTTVPTSSGPAVLPRGRTAHGGREVREARGVHALRVLRLEAVEPHEHRAEAHVEPEHRDVPTRYIMILLSTHCLEFIIIWHLL